MSANPLMRFGIGIILHARLGVAYHASLMFNHLSIRCSQLMTCFPVSNSTNKDSCMFIFVNPSARLSLERTKPIFEIYFIWYAPLAACTSNMMRFLLVREPLVIISNNDFESVRRCRGTARCTPCSTCDLSARASSNRSANAITLADNTERLTLLDLYLLYVIGMALLPSSMNSTMREL